MFLWSVSKVRINYVTVHLRWSHCFNSTHNSSLSKSKDVVVKLYLVKIISHPQKKCCSLQVTDIKSESCSWCRPSSPSLSNQIKAIPPSTSGLHWQTTYPTMQHVTYDWNKVTKCLSPWSAGPPAAPCWPPELWWCGRKKRTSSWESPSPLAASSPRLSETPPKCPPARRRPPSCSTADKKGGFKRPSEALALFKLVKKSHEMDEGDER